MMRMRDAIRAALDEAAGCHEQVAVVELVRPEAGEQRIFPCRASWYYGLPDDHPMVAKSPVLVGVAYPCGTFQTEWLD